MSYQTATVDQLAERLRRAHERGERAVVLLGAGASRSAGIPLADELLDEIDTRYHKNVDGAERTYGAYMERLTHAERNELLRPYVEKAKITETYAYLASCVEQGFVDVVLNVNFDLVAEDSLSFAHVRAWPYDLADSQHYQQGRILTPALIYLHGKFGGCNNVHTEEGMERVKGRVADVLKEHLGNRTLIVIGYSGLIDPIFDALVGTFAEFDHGLYWVSLDSEPATHVLDRLLDNGPRSPAEKS